jgi:hypothetical protein
MKKLRGNYDEKPWKCKNICGKLRCKSLAIAMKIYANTKTYDAYVVCAMKNHGNL